MGNLFKKAEVFTDIHFGLKSNIQLHNDDSLNFVKWATAKIKAEGIALTTNNVLYCLDEQ